MRQAGILAAAGLVALDQMVERLCEDHTRAARLADGLRDIPGIQLQPEKPATNMVFVNLDENVPMTGAQVAAQLKELGILVQVTGARRFRLVAHYWVDDAGVDRVVASFRNVLSRS